MTPTEIALLMTNIITAGVSVGGYLNLRKSTEGQVANQVSEAWQRLNKPLEEEIHSLRSQVDEMKIEREKHLRFIGELIRAAKIHLEQLAGLYVVSKWTPSDELKPLFEAILNAQSIEQEAQPLPQKNHQGLARR